MKITYYTVTDGFINLNANDVATFDSPEAARHHYATICAQREFAVDEVHAIKPLDRYEFGSKFTFSVYDHNGELIRSFDCHLDDDDGGIVCDDPKLIDPDFIYDAIVEQAMCDFREIGKQTGIYENPEFDCDCDSVGSEYAWIINAV